MTSHDTYREQLLDLAYGELGRREARALQAHLEGCPECRAELARMTSTRSAMSALPDERAPDRGEAILLAAAREAARERRPRPFLPSWVWGASVGVVGAAAVALLAIRLAGTVKSPVSQPDGAELVSRSAPQGEARPARPAGPAESSTAVAAEPAPPPAVAADEGRAAAPPARAAPEPGAQGFLADKEAKLDRKGSAGVAGGLAGGDLAKQAAPRPAPAKRKVSPPQDRDDRAGDEGAAPAERVAGNGPHGDSRSGLGGSSAEASAGRSAAAGGQAAGKPAEKSAAAPAPAAVPAPSPAAPREFAQPPPAAELHRLEESQADLAEGEQDAVGAVGQKKRELGAARPRSAEAKGPAASRPALEDAVARYERLHRAGSLHAVERSFPDCPGEVSRQVELDPQGRVVKLSRRGMVGDAPYRVELFYGQDGLLGAVRYWPAHDAPARELRFGAPGGAAASTDGRIPAWALEPRRAPEAGPDAPPRCRE